MKNPLVSIIIPCYNQAEFLSTTLDSVINQTYDNWECLIINDDSPDNTELIAKEYVNKDARFRYFFQENAGVSIARNNGLDHMKGDYLILLDSDDIIHPEKIEKSLDIIKSKNVDVVVSNFRRFKKTLKTLKKPEKKLKKIDFNYESFLLKWDREFVLPPHCLFFSTRLVNGIRYREELRAKQDWYFWIELFSSNPTFHYVDEVLAFYRRSNKSVTTNHQKMRKYKDLAYNLILKKLQDDNDIVNRERFISKIIDDSSHRITTHRKKEEKYKSLTMKLIGASVLLIIFLIVSLLI